MIIPAILEKNFEEIENKLEICREFASTVHVDFIDGKFAPKESFLDLAPFKKYSDYFKLEAHLMVEEPVNYLDDLADAGFRIFMGHVEKMSDQVEFVARGEELGAVGLAFDLITPLTKINVSLEDLDQILLMSVKAGESGQVFDNSVVQKIEDLRAKFYGKIEIDGGINDKTLVSAKNAGADNFCVTSFLFREKPVENFRLLESLL